MNLKELHPRKNLISSVSLFRCREGEIIALQILGDQELNVHALDIPVLLVCTTGELVVRSDNGIEVLLTQSDYFTMDSNVSHRLTALEKSNLLLIR